MAIKEGIIYTPERYRTVLRPNGESSILTPNGLPKVHIPEGAGTQPNPHSEKSMYYVENGVEYELLLTHEQVLEEVDKIADKMAPEIRKQKAKFLIMLEGGLPFAGWLFSALQRRDIKDFSYHSLHVSSYDDKMTSNRQPRFIQQELERLRPSTGPVITLDDVLDTGFSILAVRERLAELYPNLEESVLFIKRGAEHEEQEQFLKKPIRFPGYYTPNGWLEGCGLDTDGEFRGEDLRMRVIIPGTIVVPQDQSPIPLSQFYRKVA